MPRSGHPLSKRKAARMAAVQALYQIELTSSDPAETVAEFKSHRLNQLLEPLDMTSPDVDANHFQSIIQGVTASQDKFDQAIAPHLSEGWTLERCGFLLRACLRAAAFELTERADIPPKVVISEFVQIGGMFLGQAQAGLINAVLDRLAKETKPELL